MLLVVVVVGAVALHSAVAGAVDSGGCDVDGAGHSIKKLDEAVPQLAKSRFAKLFKGAKAVDAVSELVVDEQHVKLTMVGARAPALLRVSLALPAPWSGSVDLLPRAGARWCARANVVLFDKELREAAFEGLPVDVNVTIQRRGQMPTTHPVKHDVLAFGDGYIDARSADDAGAGGMRLFVGNGPPDVEQLQDGAARYMQSLTALAPEIVDEIHKDPSPEAQRVLFAETAASLKAELDAWLPERRQREIARFDERAMPAELRPLLRYWRAELLPRKEQKGDASARLIVDDAVVQLWIDGVLVFDRAQEMPTSVEVRVPAPAVRAWIVSRAPSGGGGVDGGAIGRVQVHDTRAVLKSGEIYSVTSTFVQHARGGTRRECARVTGALPGDKDIRWREVSGKQAAMLGDDETYRPSAPSAERVISVVPGGDARPFPPVPLVYSYTHPGTYKWTLTKDGGVTLELVDDPAICKPN